MQVHPHPHVTFTRLDDADGVLLHLQSKQYYSTNETGTLIWEMLAQQRSLAEIAAALAEAYEIDEAEALGRVRRFVAQLMHEDLVQERPGR